MISCSDGTRPTAPFLCASSTQDLSQVFNQVWNVVSISIMVKIVYDDHHENYYSVFNLVYSRFEIDIEGATPKVKVSIFQIQDLYRESYKLNISFSGPE